MPATVRQYELVYIVAPDRTEDQVQAVTEKYNNLITTQGGEVERTDVWERRRLAYDIKGQNEGIYIVCIFRGLPNVEAELRRVFGISEDTLRFIIVRPDEEIDASIASVAPRDYASRGPQGGGYGDRQYGDRQYGDRQYGDRQYGGNQYAPQAAPRPAAPAESPAAEDEATSEAAAASDAGVPEVAASDAGTEAESAAAEPAAEAAVV